MLDEYLTIVKKTALGLESQGCVASRFAHSEARIPHTTVQLIPIFQGTHDVLIHRRAANLRMYPNVQDFNGGHVTFEMGLMGSQSNLLKVIEQTALREAREEIWVAVNGQPHIITQADICRFTQYGELAVEQPRNVEYSTAFIVFLPGNINANDQTVKVVDNIDDEISPLACRRVPLSQLRDEFRANPEDFADGASRILSRLDSHPEFEQALLTAINHRTSLV